MWYWRYFIHLLAIVTLMISIITLIVSIFIIKQQVFISLEIPILISDHWNFKISLIIDWTSNIFSSTVIFITSIILIYRIAYIPEPEQNQFILIIIIFVLSIILLIYRNNVVFILLGWDGLGLSSYILVIFYQNPKSAASGSITVFTNRIGDALIIISLSIMYIYASWEFFIFYSYTFIILTLIILASCTKSAQFPFSAWLPAAIAAPTPISALVHSSTLVTAGVFLIIRLIPSNLILLILLTLASATAIYARLTACWEQDIKKIIAFSTLRQIAIMIFAISLGNSTLAFFHLISHALFKSIIFMTAGSVIINSSYQDIRRIASIIKNSPIISSSIGIAAIALIGLPFMSGFFSKDIILEIILKSNFIQIITILIVTSISLTVVYSLRIAKISFYIFLKTKSDITFKSIRYIEIPILFITPISILSGSLISWIIFPTQIFILPTQIKILIILNLLVRFLLTQNIQFLSLNYFKLGFTSISIWFINFISSILIYNPFKISKIQNLFDKSWQETFGPHIINNIYSNNFNKIIIVNLSPLSVLLISSVPLIIFISLLYLNSLKRAFYWR